MNSPAYREGLTLGGRFYFPFLTISEENVCLHQQHSRLLSKSNVLTHVLTPWSRVLLEKLTFLQLVKKILAFYGTRKFITAFTSPLHPYPHITHPEDLFNHRATVRPEGLFQKISVTPSRIKPVTFWFIVKPNAPLHAPHLHKEVSQIKVRLTQKKTAAFRITFAKLKNLIQKLVVTRSVIQPFNISLQCIHILYKQLYSC
jgi:hypothetical protein